MNKDSQDNGNTFDLSELAGFQFGPAWARPQDKNTQPTKRDNNYSRPSSGRKPFPKRRDGDSNDRPKRDFRGGRDTRGGRNDQRGEGRFSRNGARPERERIERPDPTPNVRTELRPANNILEVIAHQVHKNKRVLPLMRLANLTLGAPERCDLVFMKLENGPSFIHSKKGEFCCWLTEAEATSHIWQSSWLSEFYREDQIDIEAPKGNFTAIAVCKLGKELIGPVNWHGYQAALTQLYKNKYSKRMSLEQFRDSITIEKDEETITKWQESASHASIWKPTRAGADEITLSDMKSVEADFLANHYADVYEITDKVFVNCATVHKNLSPGLAAHLRIQHDRARRFPQMIIPNLCHGLARHHMPIFKWNGSHFTGPSRIRVIPTDTILADRMNSIIAWVKENSGQKVDALFTALTGIAASDDSAADAHAPYTADLIWLLDQGYIVVTDDNSVWDPKGEAMPQPEHVTDKRKPQKKGKPSRSTKPAQAANPAAAEEAGTQESQASEEAITPSEPSSEKSSGSSCDNPQCSCDPCECEAPCTCGSEPEVAADTCCSQQDKA